MRRKRMAAMMIPLTALCLFAPITDVKADTEINTYAVEGSYTVNIPAEVTVEEATNAGILPIQGTLDACYNLEITITSDNACQLVNTENSKWKIKYKLSEDKVVFSKEEGSTDKVISQYNVSIRVQDKPVVSGEYKDILQFGIEAKNYQEETKHKLIFNSNCTDEVTISTKEKFVNENEKYGMLPTPKRTGYTFDGWYTASSNGDKIDSDIIMNDKDVTVYAQWIPHKLTINYHNDGADYIQWNDHNESVTEQDVTSVQHENYGSAFSNGVSGLYDVWRWKRTGYSTKGQSWKIGKDGVDEYDDHTGFKNTQDCAEYLGVLAELEEGDVTVDLYPIWIANTYTIKYNKNCTDASGTMASSSHTYDVEKKLSKNNFTREGYQFTGWSTSEDGETVYTDEQIVSNLTAVSKGTVTLYAKWEINTGEDDQSDISTVKGEDNTADTQVSDAQDKEEGLENNDSLNSESQDSSEDNSSDTDAVKEEDNTTGTQISEQPATDNSQENVNSAETEAEDASTDVTESEYSEKSDEVLQSEAVAKTIVESKTEDDSASDEE